MKIKEKKYFEWLSLHDLDGLSLVEISEYFKQKRIDLLEHYPEAEDIRFGYNVSGDYCEIYLTYMDWESDHRYQQRLRDETLAKFKELEKQQKIREKELKLYNQLKAKYEGQL